MSIEQIGPYRLEGLLGVGGMGEVYRAYDTRRDRMVALKVLPDSLGNDDEYKRRFRRESHVAARLREPHVIPIHDYGEIDGRLFIDMRLVDGVNVREMLAAKGALPPPKAVDIIAQVADALESAHTDGLVHRDIKPSNVLVTPNGFVYVVDFGIARSIGTTGTNLTITGVTVGTLDYMAPERFTNREIDGRTDVYSLACLLYECLTGHQPFVGDDLPSLMYAHLYTDVPAASAAGGPPLHPFDAVVARGMAKEAEDRYRTATELAEDARNALATWTAQRPTRSEPGDAPTISAPVPPPPPRPGDGPPPGPPQRRPMEGPVRRGGPDGSLPPRPPEPPRRMPAYGPPTGPDDRPTTVPRNVPPPSPPSTAPPGPSPAAPASGSPARRRLLLALGAVAVVAAVLVTTLLVLRGGSGGAASPSSTIGSTAGIGPAATPTARAVVASLANPTVGATIQAGATPGYLEIAPNGRFAYIANRDAGIVSVLDTTADTVTATIPVPEGPPQFVAFSPNGNRAYISIYNTDRTINLIGVIDTATTKLLGTVPVGRRPYAAATNPDGSLLYVPSHDEGQLDVVDTTTLKILRTIPVAPNPHWVEFSYDGKRIYTANHESNLVTVLNAADEKEIARIPTGGRSPHSIALSPDDKRLAVVNFDSDTLTLIDTATNKVTTTIAVGKNPQDVAYAPDGRFLYTTNSDSNTVSVIDADKGRVTATLPTGKTPTSIAVTPDGRKAYVSDLDAGTVQVLDVGAS